MQVRRESNGFLCASVVHLVSVSCLSLSKQQSFAVRLTGLACGGKVRRRLQLVRSSSQVVMLSSSFLFPFACRRSMDAACDLNPVMDASVCIRNNTRRAAPIFISKNSSHIFHEKQRTALQQIVAQGSTFSECNLLHDEREELPSMVRGGIPVAAKKGVACDVQKKQNRNHGWVFKPCNTTTV